MIAPLQVNGTPVHIAAKSRVETILNVLEMLIFRRLVVESGGIYQAAPGEGDVLIYYANSVAHWMPSMIE